MAKKVEVEIGITGEPKYNQSIKNITASQKALQPALPKFYTYELDIKPSKTLK